MGIIGQYVESIGILEAADWLENHALFWGAYEQCCGDLPIGSESLESCFGG